MSAVHIEQAKVLAIAVNDIAVAFAVIGFVAPITALSLEPRAPNLQPATASLVAIWLCAAIGLHWIGRRVPRSIRP